MRIRESASTPLCRGRGHRNCNPYAAAACAMWLSDRMAGLLNRVASKGGAPGVGKINGNKAASEAALAMATSGASKLKMWQAVAVAS